MAEAYRQLVLLTDTMRPANRGTASGEQRSGADDLATTLPTTIDDSPAGLGGHTRAESMATFANTIAGLKRSFHFDDSN